MLEDQGSVIHRLEQVGHMVTLYHENLKGSYRLHCPKHTGGRKAGTECGRLRPSKGPMGWQEDMPSWVISQLQRRYCSP